MVFLMVSGGIHFCVLFSITVTNFIANCTPFGRNNVTLSLGAVDVLLITEKFAESNRKKTQIHQYYLYNHIIHALFIMADK